MFAIDLQVTSIAHGVLLMVTVCISFTSSNVFTLVHNLPLEKSHTSHIPSLFSLGLYGLQKTT